MFHDRYCVYLLSHGIIVFMLLKQLIEVYSVCLKLYSIDHMTQILPRNIPVKVTKDL